MLINPPDPDFEAIDGDKKMLKTFFDAKLALWLRQVQFRIPAGYISDGASVPRAMRWLYDRQSLGSIGPLCHDWLCDWEGVYINLRGETMQLPWYVVHAVFLVCMLIDGVPWDRVRNCFLAVIAWGPRWPKYSDAKKAEIRDRIINQYPELNYAPSES